MFKKMGYRLVIKRLPGPLPGSYLEWPILVRRPNWLAYWRSWVFNNIFNKKGD